MTTTVGGGTATPSSSSGIPPGWWRNRRGQRVAAAIRSGFRPGDARVARGAVLVIASGDGAAFVSQLLSGSRSLRSGTSVRDRFEQSLSLVEIGCLPGAEDTVRDAIDGAWEAFGADVAGTVEATRLPAVRYEGSPGATESVLEALAQMNLAPDPSSGVGTTVAVIDNDLREALLPGVRITRLGPDRRRIKIGFTLPRNAKLLHGTAVCAVVAAAAPGADLVWLPRPTNIEFWLPGLLAAAARHAAGGPLVVNLSWVYEVEALPLGERERFLRAVDAVLAQAMHDCLIVAAAGNAHDDDDRSPMAYPALSPYVLAVAGAAADGALSTGSRHGKPEGPWCLAPAEGPDRAGVISMNGKAFTGTSMATALVSALVAVEFGTRTALDMADHLDRLIASSPGAFLRRP